MSAKDWKVFEKKVREIAHFKWDKECNALNIAGVDVDGVIKLDSKECICIEISVRNDLGKVREDINKLVTVRNSLFLRENVFARCYVVLESEPTDAMKKAGDELNIEVLSINSFESSFFDYGLYIRSRKKKSFGSAVNPVSGQSDTTPYVPVRYDSLNKDSFGISDIYKELAAGKNIVLIGEYGTGKSRCIKELFDFICEEKEHYCLSVDLREQYGSKRSSDVIKRHFDELGLPAQSNNFIKLLNNKRSLLLLDGFDEIATSQPWSAEAQQLIELRKYALSAVKDIIKNKKGGVLISGRPHYFDSDIEMFTSLGMDTNNTVVLRCAEEFSSAEIKKYFSAIGVSNLEIPSWLPKKPLVCHVIKELDVEQLNNILNNDDSEISFWDVLFSSICHREAKINPLLDENAIKNVLIEIAALTRNKSGDVGPLSLVEIEKAFEIATGIKPSEASATMLNRLVALGRTSAQNSDRQFVDKFILDGLRSEHLINCIQERKQEVLGSKWINPLYQLGVAKLANYIRICGYNSVISYLHQASNNGNHQLVADVFCAILESNDVVQIKPAISIVNSHFINLSFSEKKISGFYIKDCIIENIFIDSTDVDSGSILSCVISEVFGVSEEIGLPVWLSSEYNTIELFQQISTQQRISKSNLSEVQKTFLELINRLFFQSGVARQEKSLYNGFPSNNQETVRKILDYLVKQTVIITTKDNMGRLYKPNRSFMSRLKNIRGQLTLSRDDIWKDISSL